MNDVRSDLNFIPVFGSIPGKEITCNRPKNQKLYETRIKCNETNWSSAYYKLKFSLLQDHNCIG